MMARLLNFTPHRELVYSPQGADALVLPQAGVVRLVEHICAGGELPNGLPLTVIDYGEPAGLPDPVDGVVYVVSQLVVLACPHRKDLVFPAGLVRDDHGEITGFSYLARPQGL